MAKVGISATPRGPLERQQWPSRRAAVRLLALHLHVISPSRAIAALRAEQLIQHDFLELLRKTRFTGEPQQLGVELEPGDRDAGLTDVVVVGQIEVVVK